MTQLQRREAPRLSSRPFERRRHWRVKVALLGRYMLTNRQEFPCQSIDMSPGGLAIVCPVKGAIGERVVVYLEHVGRVEGEVVRHIESGFAMTIAATPRKRDKLAAQLTWLANRHALGLPEDRRHERIVPRNPRTTLRMDDGREYIVRLIDVSLSGAALSTEIKPPLDMPVTLGRTLARVVRHFDGGIAVEFRSLLRPDDADGSVEI
jgi:PilZ domain